MSPRLKASSTMLLTGAKPVAPATKTIGRSDSVSYTHLDVYKRQSPACANEWARGVCDKPAVKCSECPNRRFLPFTDDAVRQHLAGQDETGGEFVIGVYPMLLDESCLFLAADFDKEGWPEDIRAVRETCGQMGLPAAVERSRSGNGAHQMGIRDRSDTSHRHARRHRPGHSPVGDPAACASPWGQGPRTLSLIHI